MALGRSSVRRRRQESRVESARARVRLSVLAPVLLAWSIGWLGAESSSAAFAERPPPSGSASAEPLEGRATEDGDEDGAAIAALEEKTRLDPHSVDARFQLANALARRGDYSSAAARYRDVLERQPGHVGARLGLATVLVLASRHGEARDTLVDGLRTARAEPNLTHALARILASSPDRSVRDGQRALELARAAFAQAKTMEHAETVALAYAEIGAFGDAARWQRTLLDEAERLGDRVWIERLAANLERYERREAP